MHVKCLKLHDLFSDAYHRKKYRFQAVSSRFQHLTKEACRYKTLEIQHW